MAEGSTSQASNFERSTAVRRHLIQDSMLSSVVDSSVMSLSEMYKCLLTLVNNFCFLINCIHWLPISGVLWSGKLPVFMVGLCGTLATLSNVVKMVV